eukprot:468883_1
MSLSLEYLNTLIPKGQTKINSQSLTTTKYQSFEEARQAVKDCRTEEQKIQCVILEYLHSQPITSFDTIQEIVSEYSCTHLLNKSLKSRCSRLLLELPVCIVPIPVIYNQTLHKEQATQTKKYVILASKPSDSMVFERVVMDFFMELLIRIQRQNE